MANSPTTQKRHGGHLGHLAHGRKRDLEKRVRIDCPCPTGPQLCSRHKPLSPTDQAPSFYLKHPPDGQERAAFPLPGIKGKLRPFALHIFKCDVASESSPSPAASLDTVLGEAIFS